MDVCTNCFLVLQCKYTWNGNPTSVIIFRGVTVLSTYSTWVIRRIEETEKLLGCAFFLGHNVKQQAMEASMAEMPLPFGWEERFTDKGVPYFVDHGRQKTTFQDPRRFVCTTGSLRPPGKGKVKVSKSLRESHPSMKPQHMTNANLLWQGYTSTQTRCSEMNLNKNKLKFLCTVTKFSTILWK